MKCGVLGLGNMGMAIFNGLNKQESKEAEILAFDKNQDKLCSIASENRTENLQDLLDRVDCVFICIKPQDFSSLEACFKESSRKLDLLISVMAGVSVAKLKKVSLAKSVVRCMPNLGLSFDKGVTAFFTENDVEKKVNSFIAGLFSTMGFCLEVDKEEQLDAVTSISGSGPAYFLYLAKVLIEEARKMGFEEKQAQRLVLYTLVGTARGVDRLGFLPAMMIDKVASKGGTTEKALEVFKCQGFDEIISEAMQAALKRAKELGA